MQLASTLEGVIYQRLVPRIGGGLVAAYEVLIANHAVRNLVREGKTRQLRNVVSTHQSEGMQTLEMALTHLVGVGLIDYETALKVSLFPKEVGRPRRARCYLRRPYTTSAPRLRRGHPTPRGFRLRIYRQICSRGRITVITDYRGVLCPCTDLIAGPSCPIRLSLVWSRARGMVRSRGQAPGHHRVSGIAPGVSDTVGHPRLQACVPDRRSRGAGRLAR